MNVRWGSCVTCDAVLDKHLDQCTGKVWDGGRRLTGESENNVYTSYTGEDVSAYSSHGGTEYLDRVRALAEVEVTTSGLVHACYPTEEDVGNTTAASLNAQNDLLRTTSNACTFHYGWSEVSVER